MAELELKVNQFEDLTNSLSEDITIKKAARCVLLMAQIIPRLGELLDTNALELAEDR
jgi:hypothetical protein